MAFTIAQLQGPDRINNQVQNNIQNALTLVSRNPLVAGILLTKLTLKSGDNQVAHKLGRTLQGWQVVRKRAASEIYDKQDANQSGDTTLVLHTSADVVVDLYVF